MLAPGRRFGFRAGIGVEVAVPSGERGAQFSNEFFRKMEQAISDGPFAPDAPHERYGVPSHKPSLCLATLPAVREDPAQHAGR
jgi:hypothetical protein